MGHLMKLWFSSRPMPRYPSHHWPLFSNTLHPSCRYSILFSSPHYTRRKLRMTSSLYPCKRCIFLLYLFIHSRSPWTILWLFFLSRNMSNRSNHLNFNNSNCFCRLCLTLGPNKILRCHCHYKPLL